MSKIILSHRELEVYQWALEGAAMAGRIARRLPRDEERMKDQIRRCTRSACVTIPEAWRKRRYPKQWINKLSDAESESAEAQGWFDIALVEGYISEQEFNALFNHYESQIKQLVSMSVNHKVWTTPRRLI